MWHQKMALYLVLLSGAFAQAQPPIHTGRFSPFIDDNINGFWEYLPRNYAADNTQKYPLLIFLHGSGELGSIQNMTTLNKVLRNGPPKIINNGTFPDSFNVSGQWYKFIVLSPQIKHSVFDGTSIIYPATIDNLIDYAKNTYRIDTNRIYLTGLSLGGGFTWDYAGSSFRAATRLSAIVVACGAADLTPEEANNIAQTHLAVLATNNSDDNTVGMGRTQANISYLMACSPDPLPKAVYWWPPPSYGHNVWTRTMENIQPGSTVGGNLTDTLGINVYQWLLQFSRITAALPVIWQKFTIEKINGGILLKWLLSNEIIVKEYIVEKSKDARTWLAVTRIPARDANQQLPYFFTDPDPFRTVSYYRIRELDINGGYGYSMVKRISFEPSNNISVFPNPFIKQITIDLTLVNEPRCFIRLLNADGKSIVSRKYKLNNLNSVVLLEHLEQLPAGNYYLHIETAEGKILWGRQVMKR